MRAIRPVLELLSLIVWVAGITLGLVADLTGWAEERCRELYKWLLTR